MAKKRGLASNRGLDALLGSIKKEKLIAGSLPAQSVSDTSADIANISDTSNDIVNQSNTHQVIATDSKLAPSAKNAAISAPRQAPNASSPVTAPSLKVTPAKTSQKTLSTAADLVANGINLLHIEVSRLQRGKYQPRIDLGEETLQELATSIRQHGVMQPIVIRPLTGKAAQTTDGITHEIIAGERRWRAAQIAGMSQIPAIERPMSDDLAIALALIENIQREDLSIMEQAVALQRFHDEFGMSHAQIADVVGKARTTVSNLLRLNQLHDEVKNALNEKQLDMGHARTLLALSAQQQPIIAKRIVNEQLTVRETEQLVKAILNPQEAVKVSKEIDYDRLRLNQQLSEQLGAVVKIKGSSAGKGSIEIYYHSPDELQALIEQLQSMQG